MLALQYHDATRHFFNRFARSSGHLDWATQPDPFRRYEGASVVELPRHAGARVPYGALYDGRVPAAAVDLASLAEFLRCSMGLSAWKAYRDTRWALRVNPSSGNLHPTEAYVVWSGRVWHYAPREHALEERCVFDTAAWEAFSPGEAGFLVALTSVHWREAWKYGERAFRYCQHDAGHAIGALRLAAALLGWRLALLPRWPHAAIDALLGLDRAADFGEAEGEEAECVAVVTPGETAAWCDADPARLAVAVAAATWYGRANALSPRHVEWPIIDRVAAATRYPGVVLPGTPARHARAPAVRHPSHDVDARTLILRRRSAVAFDASSSLPRDTLFAMLSRLLPGAPPWDAIDWPPQVHLVLFIHRVDGLVPGIYAFLRDPAVQDPWRAAFRAECLWEPVPGPWPDDRDRLFLLIPGDMTWAATRLSCDQDIAADGFFSLGMLARVDASLAEYGEWFYRRLFWECGLIGQVLYLEAEAAGARSTGIGCFYDEAVHDTLGLSGHAWQSLYHFSMGVPVEDTRLTTEPGYPWEARLPSS